ncbi:MAG: hypothetical protein E7616_10100 [Ruminococcaceae bacterium]|nr:hypothetical protein [Oscillospiraceae bacterium]
MRINKSLAIVVCIYCLFFAFSVGGMAKEEYSAAYFGLSETIYTTPEIPPPIEERLWLPKKSINCDCAMGFYLPLNQTLKERLQELLQNTERAIVVKIDDTAVQFSSKDYQEKVVTLTQATIMKVCKNTENDTSLKPGQRIWLKEQYGVVHENGIDMLYAGAGCEQNPLIPGHEYLIFPYLIENSNSVYTYSWCLVDLSRDFYQDIHYNETLLYSHKLDEYTDMILSHFNLHEEETPPSAANPSAEGPNWLAVFASIVVLGGIGALAYTVNETVKKNKSKDFK